MSALLGLLLAASIDGEAALRHASALTALGPHPWGSPRNQAAAAYVAAGLREAGLDSVELEAFERPTRCRGCGSFSSRSCSCPCTDRGGPFSWCSLLPPD